MACLRGSCLQARGKYIIDPTIMSIMQKQAVVMHPLPRVDEVRPRVARPGPARPGWGPPAGAAVPCVLCTGAFVFPYIGQRPQCYPPLGFWRTVCQEGPLPPPPVFVRGAC